MVDEPTDLPDGLEVTLAIVDHDLDEDDRRALHDSLEESYAQIERGELLDLDEVIARLRELPR